MTIEQMAELDTRIWDALAAWQVADYNAVAAECRNMPAAPSRRMQAIKLWEAYRQLKEQRKARESE